MRLPTEAALTSHSGRVIDPMLELADLVWLFEGEPSYPLGTDDAPWPYVRIRFTLTRGDISCEVNIEPADESVAITLARGDATVAQLVLHRVRALRTEAERGREALCIDLDENVDASTLRLQTKPTLSLAWSVGTP